MGQVGSLGTQFPVFKTIAIHYFLIKDDPALVQMNIEITNNFYSIDFNKHYYLQNIPPITIELGEYLFLFSRFWELSEESSIDFLYAKEVQPTNKSQDLQFWSNLPQSNKN